ncbi:MAG TPA: DUF3040 domain-containing protein [Micrococcales bacterium]|uniref:DUF3040 domain-containing protein n=1 Tax=Miniimonas arenae TaxID=676201 RepID=UPI000EE268A3|nr:DUF3040 domain-containing protein [Miniimonas arenae]HCX84151.1 DUF3040 domain-containing protein [Micrococcales bacterium]
MPLSEYEQRVLAQMERQLSSDDPKLAQTFKGGGVRRRTSSVILGVVVVAAGLAMLIGGVSQQLTWLGLLGFLAMFGGVLLALSRGSSASRPGDAGGAAGATAAKAPRKKSSFMNRLDERWDKRRDQRG